VDFGKGFGEWEGGGREPSFTSWRGGGGKQGFRVIHRLYGVESCGGKNMNSGASAKDFTNPANMVPEMVPSETLGLDHEDTFQKPLLPSTENARRRREHSLREGGGSELILNFEKQLPHSHL